MSVFQIIVLIWLLLLTTGLGLLTKLFLTFIKHHNVVDERVKDLEQEKRGNPFVKEGMNVVRKAAGRKKSNG